MTGKGEEVGPHWMKNVIQFLSWINYTKERVEVNADIHELEGMVKREEQGAGRWF